MQFRTNLLTGSIVLVLVLSALPSAANHVPGTNAITTAFVFNAGAMADLAVQFDYLGIGGSNEPNPPDENDCVDEDGDQAIPSNSIWRLWPSIAIKLPTEQEIGPETFVESQEVGDLCKATIERLPNGDCPGLEQVGNTQGCVVYDHEPQRIGIGQSSLTIERDFYPTMHFDAAWRAMADVIVASCRINPATALFTTTRNRAFQDPDTPELLVPNEKVTGTLLTGTCLDQSRFVAGNGPPGQINNANGLENAVPITSLDLPNFDMGVGLWAVCMKATLRNNTFTVFDPVSDYTWFWIDSQANSFGLAGQWTNGARWDGDVYTTASVPNSCASIGFTV